MLRRCLPVISVVHVKHTDKIPLSAEQTIIISLMIYAFMAHFWPSNIELKSYVKGEKCSLFYQLTKAAMFDKLHQ